MAHARYHLTFPPDMLGEPTIYRIHAEFGVVPNIRRANIEEHAGWMIVDLEGPSEDVDRCVAWLESGGVEAQPLEMDE
jgi:NIL domain